MTEHVVRLSPVFMPSAPEPQHDMLMADIYKRRLEAAELYQNMRSSSFGELIQYQGVRLTPAERKAMSKWR